MRWVELSVLFTIYNKQRMSRLRIIFVDSALFPAWNKDVKTWVPDKKDTDMAFTIAEQHKIDLSVHLISPNYAVRVHAPSWDSKLERKKIIPQLRKEIEVIPMRYDEWAGRVFPETDQAIYITFMKNAYEVMDFIGVVQTEKRWYLNANCAFQLQDLVVDVVNTANPLDDKGVPIPRWSLPPSTYNFYDAGKLDTKQPTADLKAVQEYASVACDWIRQWIISGFHDLRDPSVGKPPIIDNWIFNVETAPIKGYIGWYGLIPEVMDRKPDFEIRESSDYRRRLYKVIAQAMANFAVNNGLVKVEQVSATRGWNAPETWAMIDTAIKGWDMKSLSHDCKEEPKVLPPVSPLRAPMPIPSPIGVTSKKVDVAPLPPPVTPSVEILTTSPPVEPPVGLLPPPVE